MTADKGVCFTRDDAVFMYSVVDFRRRNTVLLAGYLLTRTKYGVEIAVVALMVVIATFYVRSHAIVLGAYEESMRDGYPDHTRAFYAQRYVQSRDELIGLFTVYFFVAALYTAVKCWPRTRPA